MAPMRALELFSGIGGGSLALKAAGVRTVAYCEKDPFCQAVLRSNMARGRLHSAPIFPDVITLSADDLPHGEIDIISGGFPCKGLSTAGKKAGLYEDSRSRLVRHVYRLVDDIQPSYVFLENTPTIVHDTNFRQLLREFSSRGYRCAFMWSSASEFGASHRRKRWFLLARRAGGAKLRISGGAQAQLARLFKQTVRSTVSPRCHQRARLTCQVFGNAVVPVQAFAALRSLYAVLCRTSPTFQNVSFAQMDPMIPCLVETTGVLQQDAETRRSERPKCGGAGFTIVPPRGTTGSPVRSAIRGQFWKSCMPTPRANPACAIPGRSMTGRTKHDPGNFLLSARELYSRGRVPDDEARSKLAVSDAFLATSMGFPSDWIGLPLQTTLHKSPSRRGRVF